MSTKYFNKMDFPVKFRQVWLPGAPAVELQPGHIIEGPAEYLREYTFLSSVPFDFHKVDAITQDRQFKFQDYPIDRIPVVKLEEHAPGKEVEFVEPEVKEVKIDPELLKKLPFDIETINWIQVKTDELEVAANVLGLDISSIAGYKPKEKKWFLVKLLKKALGKTN